MRTFVYGSCISRDTFEYLQPHGFELVEYVARQSVISAYSQLDPTEMPKFTTSSPFQRRMIEGDWSGSLPQRLRHHEGDIDLLLWDLCDERLGVFGLPSGGHVTRSVDGISSGLDGSLSPVAELLPVGTPKHLSLFQERLGQFRQELVDLDLHRRTLLLAPDWATQLADGRETPSSFGLSAHDANRSYRGYYRAVEDVLDLPIVRVSEFQVTGDPGHKWGPAPFHYTEGVYQRLTDAILAFSARRASVRTAQG